MDFPKLQHVPKKLWSSATHVHKLYGVYFESQRSRIISYSINVKYLLTNWGPSDHEDDDIPMCYYASQDYIIRF